MTGKLRDADPLPFPAIDCTSSSSVLPTSTTASPGCRSPLCFPVPSIIHQVSHCIQTQLLCGQ
jgi:hypothetical protein